MAADTVKSTFCRHYWPVLHQQHSFHSIMKFVDDLEALAKLASTDKKKSPQLFTVAETLTRDNIKINHKEK
jgi:hypothetical protein